MKKTSIVLALACAVAWCGSAQAGDLKVGSKAPTLSIEKWMKGAEVDLAKAGENDVYVVEFWATWCGPCKVSIPHLSEMQKHFKDKKVTFIGVSNEKADVVKKFLDGGWDSKMEYTVAIDKDNKTSEDWMEASGQEGIPTAFVVKGGKIAWIGHPMMGLDAEVAEACGDKEFAAKAKEFKKLGGELGEALEDEKWDDAVKLIDKMTALKPKENRLGLTRYMILATKKKDKEAAAKAGAEFVKNCDDAQSLNEMAWNMLTEDSWEDARDIKLAETAAKKAMDLTKEKDPAIIDTYARALADGGDLKGAVQWQTKAVEICKNDRAYRQFREDIEKALEDYQTRLNKGI